MKLLERVPLLAWFLLGTLIIVVGGVILVSKLNLTQQPQDSKKPEKVSKSVEGTQDFDIVSREHVQSGTPVTSYTSNPPSSGPHWPNPANKGIYDNSLPDEQLVHDLEHGYIWISYKPGASDDVKNKLKEIVQKDAWKIILEPREKDDKLIGLAAWGRVLNLDNLDEKRIKEFISTYRNRGPEKTAD